MGPPKVKNITFLYHVFPDPLNSLFLHFFDFDDLRAVGAHQDHKWDHTTFENVTFGDFTNPTYH